VGGVSWWRGRSRGASRILWRLWDGWEDDVGDEDGEALVTLPPPPLPPLEQIREGSDLAAVQTPPRLPECELRAALRLLVPLEERERSR
jgi:hypothetical protein